MTDRPPAWFLAQAEWQPGLLGGEGGQGPAVTLTTQTESLAVPPQAV